MSLLRQIGVPLLYLASVIATAALMISIILLSWHAADGTNSSGERLRSYYVAAREIPRGQQVRAEDLEHELAYLDAEQVVSYKTQLIGRYARNEVAAGTVMHTDLVSAQQDIPIGGESVAVVLAFEPKEVVGIVRGARLALVRNETIHRNDNVITSKIKSIPRAYCKTPDDQSVWKTAPRVLSRVEIDGESPYVAFVLELKGETRRYAAEIAANDWRLILLGAQPPDE